MTAASHARADELVNADALLFTVPLYNFGMNPALDAFTDMAAGLKEKAETGARQSGREIAELRGQQSAA